MSTRGHPQIEPWGGGGGWRPHLQIRHGVISGHFLFRLKIWGTPELACGMWKSMCGCRTERTQNSGPLSPFYIYSWYFYSTNINLCVFSCGKPNYSKNICKDWTDFRIHLVWTLLSLHELVTLLSAFTSVCRSAILFSRTCRASLSSKFSVFASRISCDR